MGEYRDREVQDGRVKCESNEEIRAGIHLGEILLRNLKFIKHAVTYLRAVFPILGIIIKN